MIYAWVYVPLVRVYLCATIAKRDLEPGGAQPTLSRPATMPHCHAVILRDKTHLACSAPSRTSREGTTRWSPQDRIYTVAAVSTAGLPPTAAIEPARRPPPSTVYALGESPYR